MKDAMVKKYTIWHTQMRTVKTGMFFCYFHVIAKLIYCRKSLSVTNESLSAEDYHTAYSKPVVRSSSETANAASSSFRMATQNHRVNDIDKMFIMLNKTLC